MSDLSHIQPSLRAFATRMDSLFPDPKNSRYHGDRNLEVIAQSLQEFGQDQPLVVRKDNRQIIKGNGRYLAAKMLGWEYIAVIEVDDDQIEAARRSIADNRSAELASWDSIILKQQLQDIAQAGKSTSDLGFNDAELAMLMNPEAFQSQIQDQQPGPSGEKKTVFTIKVEKVSSQDKEIVLEMISAALDEAGMAYKVKAS